MPRSISSFFYPKMPQWDVAHATPLGARLCAGAIAARLDQRHRLWPHDGVSVVTACGVRHERAAPHSRAVVFGPGADRLTSAIAVTECRPFNPCISSGITIFLAAVLVLDARLAGIGVMDWSPVWLERQLKPWAIGGRSAGHSLGRFHFSRYTSQIPGQQPVPGQDDRSLSGAPVPCRSRPQTRSRRILTQAHVGSTAHGRRDFTDALVPGGLGGTSHRLYSIAGCWPP